MTTCTHCNTTQQDIQQYRTSFGARAICNPCVANLAQMLPRHIDNLQGVAQLKIN